MLGSFIFLYSITRACIFTIQDGNLRLLGVHYHILGTKNNWNEYLRLLISSKIIFLQYNTEEWGQKNTFNNLIDNLVNRDLRHVPNENIKISPWCLTVLSISNLFHSNLIKDSLDKKARCHWQRKTPSRRNKLSHHTEDLVALHFTSF